MTYSDPGQPARRGSLALGLVLGIAVGLGILWVAWSLLTGFGNTARPAPSPSPSRIPVVTASPSPTSASRTPSPTPSASPTPSVETSTAPHPGVVTQLERGTLYVVLDSLPKGEVTAEQAMARAAEISAGRSRAAVVVDSDAVPDTLKGGYWAIGFPGAASRDEASAICGDFGREIGPACYPRPVN